MKFEFEKSFFLSFLFLLDLNALKKFVVIFIFVLIHELTHVFIGKIFGLKTKKIVFGLFGMHAEIINFDLLERKKKFLILISGPLINFLIWFLCKNLFVRQINFFIWSINLLPIYPLDGGRIFILILKKFNKANIFFIKFNRVMILFLCLSGIIFKSLFLFLIGVYLFWLNKILLNKLLFELYFK